MVLAYGYKDSAVLASKISGIPIILSKGGYSRVIGGKARLWQKKVLRTPTLLSCFTDEIEEFTARIRFHLSDGILTVCEGLRREIVEYYKIRSDKVFIVPVPIDVAIRQFSIQEEALERLKKKYRIGEDKVILYAGRLSPEKGLEYLIRAFRIVNRKIERAKLIIVGFGRGEYPAYLRELTKSLGVRDSVLFVGSVPHKDMGKYYLISNVFALPSLSEGLNNALKEAMYMGVAVIATRVGCNIEAVKDNETGLLVEAMNVKDLANALCKVLTDEEFAATLRKNARNFSSHYWLPTCSEAAIVKKYWIRLVR